MNKTSHEFYMITKVNKYNWAFENMNAYFHDIQPTNGQV